MHIYIYIIQISADLLLVVATITSWSVARTLQRALLGDQLFRRQKLSAQGRYFPLQIEYGLDGLLVLHGSVLDAFGPVDELESRNSVRGAAVCGSYGRHESCLSYQIVIRKSNKQTKAVNGRYLAVSP